MIVTWMAGGLGNQMYQYAFGELISRSKKVPHLLDVSAFGDSIQHNGFELNNVFGLDVKFADENQISDILGWRKNSFAKRILVKKWFRLLRGKTLWVEGDFSTKNIAYEKERGYLFGYWQSEEIFLNNKADVIEMFKFKPLFGANLAIANKAISNQSISVHIRRGDYVLNKKASTHHGACEISYYVRAMDFFSGFIKEPVFFVFSDDIDWARSNLPSGRNYVFVDVNNGENSYRDMQLMSLCKNNIIANSTFSWWGAFLNGNENKIVVAPTKWFAKQDEGLYRIPNDWMRL